MEGSDASLQVSLHAFPAHLLCADHTAKDLPIGFFRVNTCSHALQLHSNQCAYT